MALNFPNSPALNEEFTAAGVTYIWDGVKWTSKGSTSGLPLVPDEDGNVVITGTLTVEGATITGNALSVTSADMSGHLSVTGDAAVGGDADFEGNLNVAGDIDND